jgi:hypothetical protein
MPNGNNETLFIIFVACTAAAVLLQALILLALFFTVRKTLKAVHAEVEQLRSTAMPVLNHAKEFVASIGPKLDSVATDLKELTRGFRAQGEDFQASTTEILERVRHHTSRMDAMFTGVLDRVDRAGTIVGDAINLPLKQLSGFTAFAKAALGSLRSGSPRPQPQPTHSPADKDLFV